MQFYPDAETLYRVIGGLFERVLGQRAVLEHLAHDPLVLRISLTQPDAVIALDTRCRPPCYSVGSAPPDRADIGLRLAANTLHDVWMGNLRLRDAYARGLIHLETNPLAALGHLMRLAEVFRYVEQVYPDVLHKEGLI